MSAKPGTFQRFGDVKAGKDQTMVRVPAARSADPDTRPSSDAWWPQRDTFAEPEKVPWSVRSALVALIVGDLAGYGALRVLHAVGVGRLGATAAEAVAMIPLCVAAVAIASRERRRPLVALGFQGTPLRPAASAVAAALLAWFVVGLMYRWTLGPLLPGHGGLHMRDGRVDAIVGLLVLTPFLEELFYRGFLFRAIRNRTGLLLAATVSGALFSLDHLWAGVPPNSLPLTFLAGLLLCLVYERTNSLFPCVVLHAAFNIPAVARELELPALLLYAAFALAAVAALGAHRANSRRGSLDAG